MRAFDLHPVHFVAGQTIEEDSIGALYLYDDGYEFEWDDPGRRENLEEQLSELLETDHSEIGPHPNPALKARVKHPLEPGSEPWLDKIADLLEGPKFRLRMVESLEE